LLCIIVNHDDLPLKTLSAFTGKKSIKKVHNICLKFSIFSSLAISENSRWDGTEMKLALELAKTLNFTWELVTDEFQWGQIFENSTGNGILG
jgi:hypothetical protein